jgi:hypothetical protein
MRGHGGMAILSLMEAPAAAGAEETVHDRACRLECEKRNRGVEWLRAVVGNRAGVQAGRGTERREATA